MHACNHAWSLPLPFRTYVRAIVHAYTQLAPLQQRMQFLARGSGGSEARRAPARASGRRPGRLPTHPALRFERTLRVRCGRRGPPRVNHQWTRLPRCPIRRPPWKCLVLRTSAPRNRHEARRSMLGQSRRSTTTKDNPILNEGYMPLCLYLCMLFLLMIRIRLWMLRLARHL